MFVKITFIFEFVGVDSFFFEKKFVEVEFLRYLCHKNWIDYEEDFSDDTVSDARWDSWPCKGDYNE